MFTNMITKTATIGSQTDFMFRKICSEMIHQQNGNSLMFTSSCCHTKFSISVSRHTTLYATSIDSDCNFISIINWFNGAAIDHGTSHASNGIEIVQFYEIIFIHSLNELFFSFLSLFRPLTQPWYCFDLEKWETRVDRTRVRLCFFVSFFIDEIKFNDFEKQNSYGSIADMIRLICPSICSLFLPRLRIVTINRNPSIAT